ncbi:MAG: DUF6326 family protein [Candidatus Humimicrobiaceae bacterium]
MKSQSTLLANMNDPVPMLISKIWVFLSLSYIYCDVLSNMEKSVLRMLFEGNIAGIPMTQGFLLFAGISLQIPFLMVILATILPYKANRITNITAAIFMIIYQLVSFFMGSDITLHYVYFSAVEILGNAAILVLAFRWKKEV